MGKGLRSTLPHARISDINASRGHSVPEVHAVVTGRDVPDRRVDGRQIAPGPVHYRGMYFTLTRRSVTIIVDVPNEDAMFEALYDTWQITKSYPAVTPVVGAEEFGSMMQRLGLGG